jgi:ubiquinone/menaquinone biosynthesis C-methylase UbiE
MKMPKKEELENEDELYLYEKENNGYEELHRSKRLKKILEAVVKYSPGEKVLDIGTAHGDIATLLAEKGFESVALDLNKNFLNYAKKKREFGKISYVCANALNLPFKDASFDVIIMGELVEHVAYPENLLKEAKRCLKKRGVIIITTPNKHLFRGWLSGYKPPLFEEIEKKSRKDLVKKQFGPSGDDHLFVFDMPSLKKFAKKQGFKVISEGYINSVLMNPITYPLLKIMPDFLVKIPFLANKLSLGLYVVGEK